ncbi:MAG: D-alanyl-D-alanine carboxypeptidase [Clostridia bacterium]|nr:D-alanyl-D-alanine carboxypeptidase [Clostridia bacterium]
MKKLLCCFLTLLLLFSGSTARAMPVTVSSECDLSDMDAPLESVTASAAVGQKLDIKAKSAFLIEPVTGTVLYEDNADEVVPPASITKIMSLVLIMEAIDRGQLTTETVITASEHACSMGGSQIWLEPGESMTVDDLLKATVIASANDATVALAETVAGSEEGFVAMMNERAKALGMTKSHFVNCTGLDADGHVMTAHDVGLAAAELIGHPLIKNYSTVWMDTLRDGKSELVNTNKLVRFYKGTTGLKTGTTSQAGYCLAASAERDGLSLVAVIMGGETSNDRFNGAKKLLDFGFANFSFATVKPNLAADTRVAVRNGTKKTVKVTADKPFSFLSKKTKAQKIEQVITYNKNLQAPVKKGQQIGRIDLYSGKECVGTIPLYAGETVLRRTFGTMFGWLVDGLLTL